jgi:nitroimidazol reductase NimA-like FMN-containing flavoprotein (pyridoxamine 5'-phosphate oxidase superfamily)
MDNNTIKYANMPYNQVRRTEYEVKDEEWIKRILHRGAYGTLATEYQNQPFIHPCLYFFDEEHHAILFHGAKSGRRRANISFNPQVCFNVSEMGRILASEDVVNFNVEYNSVVIFGKAEVLESSAEATRALQMLLQKYTSPLRSGEDYGEIRPEDLRRTAVYRIAIELWSGKRQEHSQEYTSSFYYPHPSVQGPSS